jgi:hypothetical protein
MEIWLQRLLFSRNRRKYALNALYCLRYVPIKVGRIDSLGQLLCNHENGILGVCILPTRKKSCLAALNKMGTFLRHAIRTTRLFTPAKYGLYENGLYLHI